MVPYPFRQPVPPKPDPDSSPSLFPTLAGGSLTDCHSLSDIPYTPSASGCFCGMDAELLFGTQPPGFTLSMANQKLAHPERPSLPALKPLEVCFLTGCSL
jgi:hypothetical protein